MEKPIRPKVLARPSGQSFVPMHYLENKQMDPLVRIINAAKQRFAYIGAGVFVYDRDKSSIQILDNSRSIRYVHRNLTQDYPDVGIPTRFPHITDFVSTSLSLSGGSTLTIDQPTRFSIFAANRETFVGSIEIRSNNNQIKQRFEVTSYSIDFIVFPLYVERDVTVHTINNNGELSTSIDLNDNREYYPAREATDVIFSSDNTGAATVYPNSIDNDKVTNAGVNINDVFCMFLSVDPRILL